MSEPSTTSDVVSFPAFHLPGREEPASELRDCGGVHARVARLGAADLQAEVDAAIGAARQLALRPVASIIAALDRVIDVWTRPGSAEFAAAVALLPALTGFSPAVVDRGLGSHLKPLGDDAIGRLLDDELGQRDVLDLGVAGRRAHGPRVITHILSGNIPGLGFAPIALALALRSAVLVKSAAGDPYSAAAFARSIAAVDPDLGRCVVVHDWRGGDPNLDPVALAANVVVASGSDQAIASLASSSRGRFFGHGHKVSFAFIDRAVLDDPVAARKAARGLALDVAQWDQFGCLSPQLCTLEAGGRLDASGFAALLAAALDDVESELPPRRLGLEDRASIAAFRAEIEWAGSARDRLLKSTAGAGWTITVEAVPQFRPTCLHRSIRLLTLDDADQLSAFLAGHQSVLECTGIACAPERREVIAARLAAAGVHRVCGLGAMQTPDLRWRQSGRPRVADWVEWSIDEGYEAPHAHR